MFRGRDSVGPSILPQLPVLFIGWFERGTDESTDSFGEIKGWKLFTAASVVTSDGCDGWPTLARHIMWSSQIQLWRSRQSSPKLHVFISQCGRPILRLREGQSCHLEVLDPICHNIRWGHLLQNRFNPLSFGIQQRSSSYKDIFTKATDYVSVNTPSSLHCSPNKKCLWWDWFWFLESRNPWCYLWWLYAQCRSWHDLVHNRNSVRRAYQERKGNSRRVNTTHAGQSTLFCCLELSPMEAPTWFYSANINDIRRACRQFTCSQPFFTSSHHSWHRSVRSQSTDSEIPGLINRVTSRHQKERNGWTDLWPS